ncbi:LexA family transcriptional regulator [Dysgonomonas sp. 521]|uniref:S24 family peptidase n=1 Tax=Dysgonomonas sp. 521 TaxID=2302932 RepID=UPI0013D63EBE|nr:S24 family peptidase [Dysgonomonas sp. 521]NDV97409.1 LexA family transcriptional regulator [Dysgonomonas sp. 521]
MTARKRILKYIESKGISKYRFYKDIALSNGYLDKEGNIGSDICEKISYQYQDLNLEWLITGKGSMLKSNDTPKGYDWKSEDFNKVLEPKMTMYKLKTDYFGIDKQLIPYYEIEATAGLNTLFDNQNTQVPLDYISIPNAPKCDGALSIRGDSMYPILKAGDIICYKIIKEFQDIRPGEMYVLDIEDNSDRYLTVKYIQRSDISDEYFKLVSQNINHQPKEEHKSHIKALAIVKVSIRYNTIS